MRTTLLLVRHGARYDYANKEEWKASCARLGLEAEDPPLSALGHEQARETAAALVREGVHVILSSPYLRVIQTAQPLAHALGLHIAIENGLAEFHHKPRRIPPPSSRVASMPEVDDLHEPLLAVCATDEYGEEPVLDYFRRMLYVARAVPQAHAGKVVACFSHAASVSLVGALTGAATLREAGTFAPCGIWKLVSDDDGASWQVVARGDDNTGHVKRNDPTTYPWGFEHARSGLAQHEELWTQALSLGPTPPPPPAPRGPVGRRGA